MGPPCWLYFMVFTICDVSTNGVLCRGCAIALNNLFRGLDQVNRFFVDGELPTIELCGFEECLHNIGQLMCLRFNCGEAFDNPLYSLRLYHPLCRTLTKCA